MRKLTISICICLFTFLTNAQTSPIMVCNSTGVTCMPYYNLDTAIYYANNGDYIYLPGGVLNLSIPINKEIHIYGAGADLDSSLATGNTIINGNLWFQDTTSFSTFEGFKLNGSVCNNSTSPKIINTTFKRIYINGINTFYTNSPYVVYNNLAFENCAFINCYIEEQISNINSTLNNNLFSNSLLRPLNACSNLTIRNCIFLGDFYNSCSLGGNTIYNCNNMIIKNSIFIQPAGFQNNYPCGGGSSPFNIYSNNNLLLDGSASIVYSLFQGNLISNCNSTFLYGCPTYPYNIDSMFKLQPTSNGINAGDDATDIGIFGGAFPWKEGSVPSNPHIYHKLINGTTNINGDLPVNIKARGEN